MGAAVLLPLLLLPLARAAPTPSTSPDGACAGSCVAPWGTAAQLSSAYFLGSKTPYWAQALTPLAPMPPQCTLVHVDHVARHGSRHTTKLKAPRRMAAALNEARALGQLTPLGHNATRWLAAFLAEEEGHLGELTLAGAQEHAGTAVRLWARHADDLAAGIASGRPLVFEATDKDRTRRSRDAFVAEFARAAGEGAEGLFRVPPPPTCSALRAGEVTDFSKLRFFDSCAAYTEYKEARPWLHRLLRFTAAAPREGSHEMALLATLFEPDFLHILVEADADNQERAARKRAQASFVAAERAAEAEEEEAEEGEGVEEAAVLTPANAGTARVLFDMMKSTRAVPPASNLPLTLYGPHQRPRKLSGKVARLMKKLEELHKDERRNSSGGGGGNGGGKGNGSSGAGGSSSGSGSSGGGGGGKGSKLPGIPELVSAAYEMCQTEQDALGLGTRFCSLFAGGDVHLETLAKYELLHDLGDYYKQGAGDRLGYVASCTLLEDILGASAVGAGWLKGGTRADNSAAARAARRLGGGQGGGPSPVAVFRFGHSESIMPILSLLGLWQQPGALSLEEHFSEELAQGTSSLLNATRLRLQALRTEHPGVDLTSADALGFLAPLEEEEAAEAAAACRAAPPISSAKAGKALAGVKGRGKGSGGVSGSNGSSGGGTAVLVSRPESWPLGEGDARPQPAGFSGPLLLALKHPWAGARVSPMAANVQLLLYDCGEEEEEGVSTSPPRMTGLWARMLHNEREVHFPACDPSVSPWEEGDEGAAAATAAASSGALACPWGRIERYYSDLYARLGVGECSPKEWRDMCGGVSLAACDEEAAVAAAAAAAARPRNAADDGD